MIGLYSAHNLTDEVVEMLFTEKQVSWVTVCDECELAPEFYLLTDQDEPLYASKWVFEEIETDQNYLVLIEGLDTIVSDRTVVKVLRRWP